MSETTVRFDTQIEKSAGSKREAINYSLFTLEQEHPNFIINEFKIVVKETAEHWNVSIQFDDALNLAGLYIKV